MVYVDDMRAKYRGMIMCHMLASTENELHSMADMLGLSRRWHQKAGTPHSHYDISLEFKKKALALGAVQISRRELGAMLRYRRETGELPTPSVALDRLRRERSASPTVE